MQIVASNLYRMFLIGLVIDPGGGFGIKYSVTLVILFFLIISIMGKTPAVIPKSMLIVEGTIFSLLPSLIFGFSTIVLSLPMGNALDQLSSFATWILLPLLMQIRSRKLIITLYLKVMYFAAWGIIITFIGMWLIARFGRYDLISLINHWSMEYRIGYLGQRPIGGYYTWFVPNVYYRWTLLLIPAVALSVKENRRYIAVFLIAVTFTLSTSAILFSLLALLWIALAEFVQNKRITSVIRRTCAAFLTPLILFVLARNDISIFNMIDKLNVINSSVPSTTIKIGHITSIIGLLKSSALTFLFGTGLGSAFFSTGTNSMVINVEVSHLNLIRQFGVPYAVLFFGYVLSLFLRLYKTDEDGKLLAIGMLTLFVAAGTNPLLISPVFFLVLIISRVYIYFNARDKAAGRRVEYAGRINSSIAIDVQR